MGAGRHGNRLAKRTQGMELARNFPEMMRERMAPMIDTYLDEFKFDMVNRTMDVDGRQQPNPAHRTSMDLYPRIMKAVGASDELIEALLARLGMPDEGSLLMASELYRAVQGKDMEAVYRECKSLVEWYEGPNGPGGQGR